MNRAAFGLPLLWLISCSCDETANDVGASGNAGTVGSSTGETHGGESGGHSAEQTHGGETHADGPPTSGTSNTDGGTDAGVCPKDDTACPCGTVGCPCDEGDACDQGVCNPNTKTCVLEKDGMMLVPQGTFWMGCKEGQDTDELTGPCPVEELPFREVTLDAFWIDKMEVTKGEYRKCMDAGVCTKPYLWDQEWIINLGGDESEIKPGREDMPAASANWTQAKTFCEWKGKRLPTEAEWEKAARGIDGRKYPWGNDEPTCDRANFRPWDVEGMKPGEPCSWNAEFGSLTPVGYFPKGASVYGALDMAGNITEWVNDGFQFDVGYGNLPAENPRGVESPDLRVHRGGSWQAPNLGAGGYTLRTSSRYTGGVADDETLNRGPRCATTEH